MSRACAAVVALAFSVIACTRKTGAEPPEHAQGLESVVTRAAEPTKTDTDGDGNPDATDKCPLQVELYNGFEDEDGCPDKVPPRTCPTSSPPQVFFSAQGRANIDPGQLSTLKDVTKAMKENGGYLLEVRGHSALDEGSDARARVALGLRRAREVRDYLVINEGLPADRIVVRSFGSDVPFPCGYGEIDARDRRVELRMVLAQE